MSVQDDIRRRFAELSPALQQVARFVLEHPNDVVTASMRSVGTRAGSPPATLVRFAQWLGFDGWPQLKQAFAQDMGLGSDEAYGQRAKALVGRAGDHDLVGGGARPPAAPPATLVRFAQWLGFDGWPQLKQAFAQDMGLGSDEAYGQRAKALVGRAGDHDLVGETFEVHRRNLESTERRLGDALQQACALLEKARSVHVAGCP